MGQCADKHTKGLNSGPRASPTCTGSRGVRQEGPRVWGLDTSWTLQSQVSRGHGGLRTHPGPNPDPASGELGTEPTAPPGDSPVVLGRVDIIGGEDVERQDVRVDQGLIGFGSVSDPTYGKGHSAVTSRSTGGDAGSLPEPGLRNRGATSGKRLRTRPGEHQTGRPWWGAAHLGPGTQRTTVPSLLSSSATNLSLSCTKRRQPLSPERTRPLLGKEILGEMFRLYTEREGPSVP